MAIDKRFYVLSQSQMLQTYLQVPVHFINNFSENSAGLSPSTCSGRSIMLILFLCKRLSVSIALSCKKLTCFLKICSSLLSVLRLSSTFVTQASISLILCLTLSNSCLIILISTASASILVVSLTACFNSCHNVLARGSQLHRFVYYCLGPF